MLHRNAAGCFLLMLLLTAFLAACGPDPEPTANPDAPTFVPTVATMAVLPPSPTAAATPLTLPDERPVVVTPPPPRATAGDQPTAPPPLSPTPFLTSSSRRAVPAGQVQVERTPVLFPTLGTTRRPPPYSVPLALHPDDHYWMVRPIPSGFRNFDLEWYPFGNDVLAPDFAPYRVHHGIDFPNDTGTPVLAVADGTVLFAGPLPSARNGINYYGNTIIIQHDWQWMGQDVFTLYAHTLEMFVTEGDRVAQGQLIAGVGASGDVSGAHLHLEVRIGSNNYFDVRNPLLWLAPFSGHGTLAGRFVDLAGRPISSAPIVVKPVNVATVTRRVLTYWGSVVKPDDIFQENFVVGDLPAGRYIVELTVGDRTYSRDLDILPGRTNRVVVQADIEFAPTPTPTSTPTPTTPPEPTVGISTTLPVGTPTLP